MLSVNSGCICTAASSSQPDVLLQGQRPQQAPWDPEADRQEAWTDGLSVEQLAHHDWVNGQSSNRNPDKQGTISRLATFGTGLLVELTLLHLHVGLAGMC